MKKLIVTGVLLIGLATGLKAQYVLREADTEFNRFHYKKAAVLYERAYKKKATRYAAGRLGDCYRLNLDDVEAEAWYAIASKGEAAKPDMVLQYADVLRRNAKYPEAKQQYERYAGNADVKSRILSCDTAQAWVTQPSAHRVSNVKELNTSASDWAPVIYDGQVVLASDRGVGDELAARKGLLRFGRDRRPDTREDGWTGNNYMHLLYQNTAEKVKEFPLEADTRYHVGPASFSLDDEMFFARTYVSTRLTGRMTTIRLEIFSSKKDAAGRWGKPQAFAYNKPDLYSVGDPFITFDGKTLYFSSDMPGGKGGMDIYKCVRKEDGSWSAPEAVNAVNTPGNERTPAMASGVFYFSSDGYIGLGGLDIMRLSPGAAVPQNMGVPVNSSRDDFACALWPWGRSPICPPTAQAGRAKTMYTPWSIRSCRHRHHLSARFRQHRHRP
ncbi:hypothetical protein MKQ70_11715 [Chitinophaga sedimenti]|uniref:hypothetical protein n=1 Tax=Chitinophaga sedimenti TaxID=2033606 RepID=UPI00200427FC|nr:hypothetical protein [Chitinophaga sedimenti]MCK7555644.1 hypothetical protein [Chitinophaga sedimenti]